MLLYVGIDVAHPLAFEYFIDGNEYARFLHIAESVVDGGAEELLPRTEAHVGIDEWRDVVSELADFGIEYLVILTEVVLRE